MELVMRRSVVDAGGVKKEVLQGNCEEEDGGSIEKVIRGSLTPELHNSNPTSRQGELESAQAAINEAREENERVKTLLSKIMKDYQSLQMQFYNLVQDQTNKPTRLYVPNIEEPEDLVSLSLGRTTTQPRIEEMVETTIETTDKDQLNGILSLGFNSKLKDASQGTVHSCEGNKNEGARQPWLPNKVPKRSAGAGDNEESQQTHVKKARVSVKARCDTPNMIDGCKWRKYGQKISKGNPCPRAYYRCAVAPGCPAKKQVQRCAEDMTILTTTYEGTHNHPLPASAAAMASITTAAATTLTSGSLPSRQITCSAGLHGLDFDWTASAKNKQYFYVSNYSDSSLLTYPTITLDLTSPSTSSVSSKPRTRPSPTYFNFSSSDSSSQTTNAWRSTSNNYLRWGSQATYQKMGLVGSFSYGKQSDKKQFYQNKCLMNNNPGPSPATSTERVAAATKDMIASDPSFQFAMAAAISPIVSNGGGDGIGQALDKFSSSTTTANNYTQIRGMFLPSPMPLSSFMSGSTSTVGPDGT